MSDIPIKPRIIDNDMRPNDKLKKDINKNEQYKNRYTQIPSINIPVLQSKSFFESNLKIILIVLIIFIIIIIGYILYQMYKKKKNESNKKIQDSTNNETKQLYSNYITESDDEDKSIIFNSNIPSKLEENDQFEEIKSDKLEEIKSDKFEEIKSDKFEENDKFEEIKSDKFEDLDDSLVDNIKSEIITDLNNEDSDDDDIEDNSHLSSFEKMKKELS